MVRKGVTLGCHCKSFQGATALELLAENGVVPCFSLTNLALFFIIKIIFEF